MIHPLIDVIYLFEHWIQDNKREDGETNALNVLLMVFGDGNLLQRWKVYKVATSVTRCTLEISNLRTTKVRDFSNTVSNIIFIRNKIIKFSYRFTNQALNRIIYFL